MCVLGTKHGSCTRAASALTSASSDSQIIFWSKMDFLSLWERHKILIPWPLPASTVQSCPHLLLLIELIPALSLTGLFQLFKQAMLICLRASTGLCSVFCLVDTCAPEGTVHKVHYFLKETMACLLSVILIPLSREPHSNFSYSACVYFRQ